MKKAKDALEDDAEALDAHLEQLERKFDRLKGLYESYFLGTERQLPGVPRREMNRLILQTQQLQISKVVQRFRFQTLLQRWVTYTAYWNRTTREIENGTYRRDVAKAQRLLAKAGGEITPEQAIALGIPAGRAKSFAERQNRMLRDRGGSRPPAKTPVPGLTQGDLEDFYQRYKDARAKVGDSRPLKSLDELKERLAPQIAKVVEGARGSRVMLEVAVEDGRVKVRARPIGSG